MKKLALFSILVLSLVSFTGCMSPRSANALTVSEEKKWPDGLPTSVPKFKETAIANVKTIPNSVLIKYNGVTKEEYLAYTEELGKNKWELNFETSELERSYKIGNERLDISLLEDGAMLLDYSKGGQPLQ